MPQENSQGDWSGRSNDLNQPTPVPKNPNQHIKLFLIVAVVAVIITVGGLFLLRGVALSLVQQPIGVEEIETENRTLFSVPELYFETTKTKIATIPNDRWESIIPTFSPNGLHIAYATVGSQEGNVLYVDDAQGEKVYERISTRPVWNPQGTSVAYGACRDTKQFVVVQSIDGKIQEFDAGESLPDLIKDVSEGEEWIWGWTTQCTGAGTPVWSPDGKKLSFISHKEKKSFEDSTSKGDYYTKTVVTRNFESDKSSEGKVYDSIGFVIFSPNSEHLAYLTGPGPYISDGVNEIVIDGIEEPPAYRPSQSASLMFHPRTNQLVYLAELGDGNAVVIGDKKEKTYQDIHPWTMMFTPEGNLVYRVAYNPRGREFISKGADDTKFFMVIAGEEGKKYNKWFRDVSISQDGKHVVYVAKEDEYWILGVDGGEFRSYDHEISSPVLTSDMRKVAYIVGESARYSDDDGMFAVFGDKRGEDYDGIYTPLQFNSDASTLSYGIKQGNELFWVEERIE
jgi:hypothetical protein